MDPRISRCASCSPCAPDQEPASVQRGSLTSRELTSAEKKEDREWNQSLQALDPSRGRQNFLAIRAEVSRINGRGSQQQWLRMVRSRVACCRSVPRHWTGRPTRWIAEIWRHNYYTVALCCRTSHVPQSTTIFSPVRLVFKLSFKLHTTLFENVRNVLILI